MSFVGYGKIKQSDRDIFLNESRGKSPHETPLSTEKEIICRFSLSVCKMKCKTIALVSHNFILSHKLVLFEFLQKFETDYKTFHSFYGINGIVYRHVKFDR